MTGSRAEKGQIHEAGYNKNQGIKGRVLVAHVDWVLPL